MHSIRYPVPILRQSMMLDLMTLMAHAAFPSMLAVTADFFVPYGPLFSMLQQRAVRVVGCSRRASLVRPRTQRKPHQRV